MGINLHHARQSGNPPRTYGNDISGQAGRLQSLRSDLLTLADRYSGRGQADVLRLVSQVECMLARAGAR